MTPRDWTALGLRLFGVWYLLTAVPYVIDLIGAKMEWWDLSSGSLRYYLIRAVVNAVVGLALARKAESLANVLLGRQPETEAPAEPEVTTPSDAAGATP